MSYYVDFLHFKPSFFKERFSLRHNVKFTNVSIVCIAIVDIMMVYNSLFICSGDRPLIVQFAAHDAQSLADAACAVAPFSDGVDLNCGCPQRCSY